jgi:hypothetical protein
MKTKLTLTFDKAFLPKAKRYAREHGVSLSQLIEQTLKKIALKESPTFSEQWRGKFHLSERTSPRYKALKKRYQ